MPVSSKARAQAIAKRLKTHKLVQAWVSKPMWKALSAKAKSEERSLANFVRRELGKLVDMTE